MKRASGLWGNCRQFFPLPVLSCSDCFVAFDACCKPSVLSERERERERARLTRKCKCWASRTARPNDIRFEQIKPGLDSASQFDLVNSTTANGNNISISIVRGRRSNFVDLHNVQWALLVYYSASDLLRHTTPVGSRRWAMRSVYGRRRRRRRRRWERKNRRRRRKHEQQKQKWHKFQCKQSSNSNRSGDRKRNGNRSEFHFTSSSSSSSITSRVISA